MAAPQEQSPRKTRQTTSADLQQRLTFQSRVSTSDEYGNEQAGFADQFTENAQLIVPSFGNEQVVASRLSGVQPLIIKVRMNSRTVQIQADWRAIDARNPGIVYALSAAPVDRQQTRRWLEIPATLGAAAA